jgi:hypothetical protein
LRETKSLKREKKKKKEEEEEEEKKSRVYFSSLHSSRERERRVRE